MRPHSVSRMEHSQLNIRRDDSRLSLAAHHETPHPTQSTTTTSQAPKETNQPNKPSINEMLRPLRFEQPGTVGREEVIGRNWLFEEVGFSSELEHSGW